MNYGEIINELGGNPFPEYNALIWFYFNINFGIIGPLITGTLAITAGKYSKRFRS